MDLSKLDAVARELSATRAEVLGLALLVLGGLVVGWLVVRTGVPAAPTAGVVDVATPVGDLGVPDMPAPSDTAIDGTEGVVVHVTGAVTDPGVVDLSAGSRVVDVITAAGGATSDADLAGLNLARLVVDGERVHVPTPEEVAAGDVANAGDDGVGGDDPAGGTAWLADGRLDLNRATGDDLEELPGVGPVLAGRIVDWRDGNGGFDAVGQLREVSGIGEKTFQALAPLVVVA